MVTYNVHQSLARAVIDGAKTSILKPHSKRKHAAVGDLLHICCGNLPPHYGKSEGYHRLMVSRCSLSLSVSVTEGGFLRDGVPDVQGHRLELMAQAEGFERFTALQLHLDRMFGLPWEGQLLRWKPAEAEFRAQWPLPEKVETGTIGGGRRPRAPP
jgi:hypothetical protein